MKTQEESINQAIKNGEFILHYQPKYSLKRKLTAGVEALIRWDNPEKGLISPDHFIPLLEENGQIVTLGNWILREACRQFNRWDRPDMMLHINISAVQLTAKDFLRDVQLILQEENMNPRKVNLELTETTVMQDSIRGIETLKGLRSLGVSISIDDFGVGYSSLAYLKNIPATDIKVDRLFINDINKNAQGEVILTTIIQLMKTLNFRVTAEGVETSEQLHFLKDLSCDEIQGYLLSPPVKPEELLTTLEDIEFRMKLL